MMRAPFLGRQRSGSNLTRGAGREKPVIRLPFPLATGRQLMALLVALSWIVVVVLGPALPAEAHANLVRSEPAANSVLPDAPPAVQLWFSEPPEPRFSEIVIYTSAGVPVPVGPLEVAPEDRQSLFVRINGALQPGTYTVAWKTLSAIDGHTTAGAFAFGVGVGQTVTGPARGVLAQVGQTSSATPGGTLLRWLGYLAMATLVGGLGFVSLILDPALVRLRRRTLGAALRELGPAGRKSIQGVALESHPEAAHALGPAGSESARRAAPAGEKELKRGPMLWPDTARLAITRVSLQVIWGGFWLTVVTTAAAAVAQAAGAAGVPVGRALSPAPGSPLATLITQTRYGQVWLGRLALLALLAFGLTRLRASRRLPSRRERLSWYLAAGIAAAVPLTTSLGSHAAAVAPATTPAAPTLPVVADWVHLVATGLWIGGLVQLALALPFGVAAAGQGRRYALLAEIVSSFSAVATVCVAALLLTGLYQSLIEVASLGALFGTTYGWALAVKLALVALLLLLGAFNLLVSRRRLAQAAALAGSAGPSPVAPLILGRLDTLTAFRWAVRAEVVLGCAVLVAVGVMTQTEPARQAWAAANRGLTLEKTADDLRLRLRVDPGEPGFNVFTLSVWLARSNTPVKDAEKVALIFTMVEHDMGENELVLEPQGDGTYQAQSGLASMVGTWRAEALVRRQGRDDVRATFELKLGASQPAPGGTPGAAGTPVAPAEARFLRNPIPATPDSLQRGQQLYQQNCAVCHGPTGRGDGPAARAMRPPPADLTQHVAQHTEGELWYWITNGIPGTQMPAWKGALTDDQRWDVVNYIVSAFGSSPSSQP